MPEMTPLGKKALSFVKLREKMESDGEVLNRLKEELVTEFHAAKRDSIRVDGKIVSYRHVEKEQISVKAPENN